MGFSDVLTRIMLEKNIKASDIHRQTGLNRPYISKLLNGTLIPALYDTVDKIVQELGLGCEDAVELTDSYLMSRLSDDSKSNWQSFKSIYRLRYNECDADGLLFDNNKPKNASVIKNRELITAILRLFSSTDVIRLFFAPVNSELTDKMIRPFSALPRSAELRWLMPVTSSEDDPPVNLAVFANSLSLMSIRECVVMKDRNDLEMLLRNSLFPFCVMTDSYLVLFDENLQTGQFFDDPEILSIYRERFDRRFEQARAVAASFDRAESALTFCSRQLPAELGKNDVCYIAANEPCILFDISNSDIEKNTIEKNDDHTFAEMYIRFLKGFIVNIETIYDTCSVGGLTDYLDSEEWYELGRHFSKSMSKEFRRAALEYKENLSPLISTMLRIPDFNRYSFIGADILSGGAMIFVYDFEEKPLVVTVNDKSLARPLISLMNELKKIGIIDSEERTKAYIKAELEKRKTDNGGK